MSTNARIGLKVNGGIVSVYHHWDGYPQWLGVQLTQKYSDVAALTELIDGGDISCLASDTDWDRNTVPEHVQYYSQRGEDCPPALAESITEYFEQCDNCGAEYGYVFEDGEWFCYDVKSWSESYGQLVDIPEPQTVQ